jgi:hypothetical protein
MRRSRGLGDVYKRQALKRTGVIKTTLDNKHNEIIKSFKYNEDVAIPKGLKQIDKLETMLIKTKNKTEIIELINKYKNTIKALRNKEKNYYLNNSKYIFDYFENKKNISSNEMVENSDKNDIVKQFFSLNLSYDTCNNIMDNPNKNNLIKNDSNKNIDKYFNNIDPNYLNYDKFIYPSDICNICNNGELIFVESEGMTICSNCSNSIKYLIDIDKPSYKEPPKEVCSYAYKRINHLKEILAQFQAKESTNIPDEVFENIKNQIKKERISLSDLSNKKTKEILKNLGSVSYTHLDAADEATIV